LRPHPLKWSPAPWFLYPGYFPHIPISWIQEKTSNDFCINAYCVAEEDFLFIQKECGNYDCYSDFFSCLSLEILIENHWSSLGFDICSTDLVVSAISTTREMEFAGKYECIWNEYGLIKNRNFCTKLINSEEFNPHDPTTFIPVEIYTNYFAPVKNGDR